MFLSQLPASVAEQRQTLRQQIIDVTPESFGPLALGVFQYQAAHNPVYRQYLHYLNRQPNLVTDLPQVPFMPIGFFKNHAVLTGLSSKAATKPALLTFSSSGTTGQTTSRHHVPDPDLYDAISTRIFEATYGPLQNLPILALLPSYLERNNSSLVYMVQRFMARSGSPDSGFFLNDHDALTDRLHQLITDQPDRKILLIGVTFGLLDWAESGHDLTFLGHNPNLIVMETGGMKGRRKELLREEVHAILTSKLGIPTIHSEYGMTELLSQAYSAGEGVFRPSPTLRVFLRDINDPFLIYSDKETGRSASERRTGERRTGERRTGGMNVVDLANLDSCAFIETQDLGQYVGADGDFRVIGRFDNSDVRGCNLLVLS